MNNTKNPNCQFTNCVCVLTKYVYRLAKLKTYSFSSLEKLNYETSKILSSSSKPDQDYMIKLMKEQSNFIMSTTNYERTKQELLGILRSFAKLISNDKNGKIKFKIEDCSKIEMLIESSVSKINSDSICEILLLFSILIPRVNIK